MYLMKDLQKYRKRKCQLFGTTGKPSCDSSLLAVVHLGDEQVALHVRGVDFHDVVLLAVEHFIETRLDVGGFLVPVEPVALNEHHAQVVSVATTRGVVGYFGRCEVTRRVRGLDGDDVMLAAVDRCLELPTDIVLLLVEVVLGAGNREQTHVATANRLRAHFESLRRLWIIIVTASNDEHKSEKHDRKHCLPDFHRKSLLLSGLECAESSHVD